MKLKNIGLRSKFSLRIQLSDWLLLIFTILLSIHIKGDYFINHRKIAIINEANTPAIAPPTAPAIAPFLADSVSQ